MPVLMRSRDNPATVRCPCLTRSTSIRVAYPVFVVSRRLMSFALLKYEAVKAAIVPGDARSTLSRTFTNSPASAFWYAILNAPVPIASGRGIRGPRSLRKYTRTLPCRSRQSSTNGGRLRGIHITPAFVTRHVTRFSRQPVDRRVEFTYIPSDASIAQPSRSGHPPSFDHLIESVGRHANVRRGGIPPNQARCESRWKRSLPRHFCASPMIVPVFILSLSPPPRLMSRGTPQSLEGPPAV